MQHCACIARVYFISQVIFGTPVSTVEHPKINEWLTLVEKEMRVTLASSLAEAVQDIKQFKDNIDPKLYMQWVDKYQAQIIVLAAQILWSEDVEAALVKMNGEPQKGPLESVLQQVENTLNVLADSVLQEQPQLRRKKLEHLVICLNIIFVLPLHCFIFSDKRVCSQTYSDSSVDIYRSLQQQVVRVVVRNEVLFRSQTVGSAETVNDSHGKCKVLLWF